MSNISHRSQRLASAVYLLTNFFGDQEPLKWKLRSLASELVSYSNSIKDNYSAITDCKLKAASVTEEIKSFLNVSKTAGLVSETNHSLIIPELNKYIELVAVPEGISDVLNIGEETHPEEKSNLNLTEKESLKIKDRISQSADHVEEKRQYLPEVSEHTQSERVSLEGNYKPGSSRFISKNNEKASLDSNKNAQLKDFGAVSVKRNSRQSAIVSLLKRKKEIMIKDVSPLISNCSEKTIQRELLAMVKAGILVKHGEKRWSRYSLA